MIVCYMFMFTYLIIKNSCIIIYTLVYTTIKIIKFVSIII